jgi:hypothetical protein
LIELSDDESNGPDDPLKLLLFRAVYAAESFIILSLSL